ncbi:MAG: YHYH protein [Gallionella sp.]
MTDTLETPRRKIGGATELESVVRTMKALAASSLMQYERAVYSIVFILFMLCLPAAHAHEAGQIATLDAHALPLGDGKVSSEPRRGYVYACMSSFRGGGARHVGGWIHGATWDETQKIHVQGAVSWPDASITIRPDGDRRLITSNALPDDHTTGIFPVRRDDPAFQIDRNPNSITAQTISLALPLMPAVAGQSSCVPMGMIGIALDGVPFFNALDDAGRDAVAHEVQDSCDGHPQHRGEYHYHGPSPCMKAMTDNNTLIGYALDGFGIYSMYDEHGRELTNNDLDECHGRVSRIIWDGEPVEMYHYVLTREYPYTVGCFRGAVASTHGMERAADLQRNLPDMHDENGQRRRQPPAEALNACSGSSAGSSCSFVSPRGDTISGTCHSPAGELACVPQRR